ncbi:MAG: PQQ-binding-like beta-propeller repeat protein [Thermoplasmata archaeon]|nr:PQQ-binding-like beta-propeller repeat protein [Thermoplasmata archaeon]
MKGPPTAPRSASIRPALGLIPIALVLVLLSLPTPPGAAVGGGSGSGTALLAMRPYASLQPFATGSTDWTTFHGGENHSGYSPFDGPINPAILWTHCIGQQPIRVGPVANATLVFVADALGTVEALERNNNGTALWTVELGTTPTTPDLSGGLLLLGGSDGYVSALNSSTGAIVWATSVGGTVAQGVSVDNSSVFVTTIAGEELALSLPSGSIEWRRSLDAPLAGAPAVSGGVVYSVSRNGTVYALSENGSIRWSENVGAASDTGPAVADGLVVVADRHANITAFDPVSGATRWRWAGAALPGSDAIESTPAVAPGSIYVQTDLGTIAALYPSNGSLRWTRSVPYTGYATLSSPAAGPNAVYFADAQEELIALSASTGRPLWGSQLNFAAIYSSPALDRGALFVGDDVGCLFGFGRPGGEVLYPVAGSVVDVHGRPVAGAGVDGQLNKTTSLADGSFEVGLPNGSLELTVSASGFVTRQLNVTVAGPLSGVTVVLTPVFLYAVRGIVRDSLSGHGIPGVSVLLEGDYQYVGRTTTGPDGSFTLDAPNGSNYLSLGPPSGYPSFSERFPLGGAPVELAISLSPLGAAVTASDPQRWDVVLPVVALAAGAGAALFWDARRRRLEAGLPSAVMGPFGRFVMARALLIPAQVVAILSVLYVFGTFLPTVARNANPCSLSSGACSTCSWSNLTCVVSAFGAGYETFLVNLFTGNWGTVAFGALREPAVQFLAWWLPDSIELALFALALSALIAYPLGLISGWHPDSLLDGGIRLTSLVGLLLPTILFVLLVLGGFYTTFTNALGDAPFGLLPSATWYVSHGGEPAWIGAGSNTGPTGLPLVDGLWHGDWAFERLVLAKTLLQSLLIASVYVAIFLRYARTAVAEVAGEPHLTAARARGVGEATLLWRHTGRRVLPVYLLLFGVTLPVYLGTQAVVEALFNDTGVGTLLIAEMTHFENTGFGFGAAAQGSQYPGNFYQVTILLLVLVVLVGNLLVDVLSRYLDPRDAGRGRT